MKTRNTMTNRSALVHMTLALALVLFGTAACGGATVDAYKSVQGKTVWDKDGKAYYMEGRSFGIITPHRTPDADRSVIEERVRP